MPLVMPLSEFDIDVKKKEGPLINQAHVLSHLRLLRQTAVSIEVEIPKYPLYPTTA